MSSANTYAGAARESVRLALEEDLDQRFAGLRRLLESTDRINPGVLLDESFRLLFERLRTILPCDCLQVFLTGGSGGRMRLRAAHSATAPDHQELVAAGIMENKAFRPPDVLLEIAASGSVRRLGELELTGFPLLSSSGMKSGVAAPLIAANEHLGAIVVASRFPDAFPDADLGTLALLAEDLSALVAKGRLYELVIQTQLDSERLLRNVLPEPVVKRLKAGEQVIADGIPEATVVFVDIVNFVQLSASMSPAAVIIVLNRIFSAFDALCEQYGVEKIKTIGDAYMLATGVPKPFAEHVHVAARIALDMQELSQRMRMREERSLSFRIGIHTGPVVAGVIGTRKFSYDLWGDTVNIASRMEAHGLPGRIHVTRAVRDRLLDDFEFEPRGNIDVKGMGQMETYFMLGTRPGNPHRSRVWTMVNSDDGESGFNRRLDDA